MTAKCWNCVTVALVLFLAASCAAINYRLNEYGLFGNVVHCTCLPHTNENERTAKYLYAFNYIPLNFDAVLIGSSISDNWDTAQIRNYRVYNASIDGGNISEEKLIADNVLRRGHIRLTLILVYPYLTATHGRKSGYMIPQEYWGALGSLQLIREYLSGAEVRLGMVREEFNSFGRDDFPPPPPEPHAAGNRREKVASFHIDPEAEKEFGSLVAEARSAGAQIVAILPPIAADKWSSEEVAYRDYDAKMLRYFLPNDIVIDMNDRALEPLREDSRNFPDGLHLTSAATSQLIEVVNMKLSGTRVAALSRLPQQ